MKDLIIELLRKKYHHGKEFDFSDGIGGTVKVYIVETEDLICKFWNSSNNSSFNITDVCKEIAEQLVEDEEITNGRVYSDFKEIMFEILTK